MKVGAIGIGPVEAIRIGPVEAIRIDTKRINMTKYISSNQNFFEIFWGFLRLIETYNSLTAWQIMKDENQ